MSKPIQLPEYNSTCNCPTCTASDKLYNTLRAIIADDANVDISRAFTVIGRLLISLGYYNGSSTIPRAIKEAHDCIDFLGGNMYTEGSPKDSGPDIQVITLDPNNPEELNNFLKRIFGDK
jgi:hypothetical protein